MDIDFYPKYQINSKYICISLINMILMETGHWMELLDFK